jgi:aminopeptidase-like protein
LCNDNLSGIAVAALMARQLISLDLRYSYRFLFIPGTIGSITWLALNEEKIKEIKQGLVLSLLGDAGDFTYKKTREGSSEMDAIVQHVFAHELEHFEVRDFLPYGYDERQYSSPGINIPMGCLMRTAFGEFEEYHTSADNLNFVRADKLNESLLLLLQILLVLENNKYFQNLNPKCEPQLGKRGLYDTTGGSNEKKVNQLALLWVLNQSDGTNSLLQISEKANMNFFEIDKAARILEGAALIRTSM